MESRNGNILTEDSEIVKRRTEYCKVLYNYPINPDENILNDNRCTCVEDNLPILKSEVEHVMNLLCQKIWDKKEWPYAWAHSLIIPISKKGDLRKCNNYKTNSLISYPSKIMLRIILNRLNQISENFLAEDKAGFRKKRSTIEQLLNYIIMA